MFNRINQKLSMMVTWLLLVAVGYIAGNSAPSNQVVALPSGQASAQNVAQAAGSLTPGEQQLADIYSHVSHSIVSISISEPFSEGFEEVSGGSGFVLDKQGDIVTNFHVVHGVSSAGRIVVNFIDGTIVRATVVGEDANADVAVIKVDLPEDRLFPVTFGDSDQVVIGQTTVALGSPFGQKWTMTTGIISALDRAIDGLNNYQIGAVIQTDAAINPGNSGGPLLNLNGEVLGINSQIISEERLNSGIAFAVPGNLVKRVAQELIEKGAVEYAYLGIQGNDITLDIIEGLHLDNNTQGVAVSNFSRRGGVSPAQQGGLQVDDVITAIDDKPVTSFGTLIAYLSTSTEPGQIVKLTVLRGGQNVDLNITLGKR
ncbi:MAG TPA: trypsin-like peptidase domain-containing protein [Phototrophicaceae bacterium]|nr:trypsin-like peptidase domain-containing protein [Phototrophicaceae bacterium]